MSLFEKLSEEAVWKEYLEYKLEKRHLSRSEEADLRAFIENREYLTVCEKLCSHTPFPLPEKKLIHKLDTDKKRIVYVFPREENYVWKLLTFLLLREYDDSFSDTLYSFRVQTGVNKAMRNVLSTPDLCRKYVYKADISNYFNSIPVSGILEKLNGLLKEEPEVLSLFTELLTNPEVLDCGRVIREEKGVMAGTPFAVFLANVYLMDLDKEFEGKPVIYARYSDDILILADDEETREEAVSCLWQRLREYGLSMNEKKELRSAPGEGWNFLGIGYENGTVDISAVAKEKLKHKIRRRTRAIQRWQRKRGATGEQAAKALIRAMNRKFFAPESGHELTWNRWYFPVITTDTTLQELDHYLQGKIRFLATGKQHGAAYRFTYENMKECGYRSLLHEWYAWKERKNEDIPEEIQRTK